MRIFKDVVKDAHNLVFVKVRLSRHSPRDELEVRQCQALCQRIYVGQVTPDERFVHHDRIGCCQGVVLVEKPAADKTNSENVEEVWGDRVKVGHGRVSLVYRLAGDRKRKGVISLERQTRGKGSIGHTRNSADPIDELMFLNYDLLGLRKVCNAAPPRSFARPQFCRQ